MTARGPHATIGQGPLTEGSITRFRPAALPLGPALLLLAAAVGCRTGAVGRAAAPPSGSAIITQEEILASGATTAWEAIKRGAPFLSLRERSSGEPARMWRRGRGSFYLDDAPTVVLDGVRQPDFRSLHLIPAHTILVIYIFTGIDGTTYYGTGAAGGVIEIRTKDGGAR